MGYFDMLATTQGKYPSRSQIAQHVSMKAGTPEDPLVYVTVMNIIEMTEEDYNDYTTNLPTVVQFSFSNN